jgi:hypothetical protein
MADARTAPPISSDEDSTFTDNEVREAANEKDLEEARPIHGTVPNVINILHDAGVSGGSDNTAVPAYGNASHVTPKDHLKRVEDAPAAQAEFHGDETEGTTVSSE